MLQCARAVASSGGSRKFKGERELEQAKERASEGTPRYRPASVEEHKSRARHTLARAPPMHPPNGPVQKRVHAASPNSIADNGALLGREADGCTPPPMAPLGPAAHAGTKMIAAPFAYTLRYELGGSNVAMLSVPTRGHIYFGTSLAPPCGGAVAMVDNALAPQAVRTGMRELCGGDDDVARHAVLWVLRGSRLHGSADNLPTEVALRLRVGFFDFSSGVAERVVPYSEKLHRRVMRLHKVLAERGGAMLGVRQMQNGRFRFSLRSITSMLTCSSDALAALICENHGIATCFSGKVSYATDVRSRFGSVRRSPTAPQGLMCMSEGVPVGQWMRGRYRDTGYGLLCRAEDIYYRVITRGDVSRLVRCKAGDIDYESWTPKPVRLGRVLE